MLNFMISTGKKIWGKNCKRPNALSAKNSGLSFFLPVSDFLTLSHDDLPQRALRRMYFSVSSALSAV